MVTPEGAEPADGGEREGGRRRGRGRDRNRRERPPVDENGQPIATEGTAEAASAPVDGMADAGADGQADGTQAPATAADPVADASPAALTMAPAAPAPASVAPVAAPRALPPVAPFVLPLDDLQRLAEASGLQWINSDAEKIHAAQAAMAAEPAPVHVPRERKPMVVIDEGPLVLVETRKDLSQLKLPFEQATPPAA